MDKQPSKNKLKAFNMLTAVLPIMAMTAPLANASVEPASTSPHVTEVTAPANDLYALGEVLSFTVVADEVLSVDTSGGTPALSLTIGSTSVSAEYASGADTDTLTFVYTVQAGEEDTNGIEIDALALNNGIITNAAGNELDTTLVGVADTEFVLVDAVVPVINSVSVPIPHTHVAGETIDFVVKASENIIADTTDGTPTLELTVGTDAALADYVGGTNRDEFVFRYTVRVGDVDTDGIELGTLSLNGGSFVDVAGNALDLTINGAGDTREVLLDGVAPLISDVAVPADATYREGETLDFFVATTETVQLNTEFGNPPFIDLTVGDETVNAEYVAIDGLRIQFQYTVQNGDLAVDGIVVGSLNATLGKFSDVAGNALDLTLNNLDSTVGVLVDAVAPGVSSVVVPTAGTYVAGDVLTFTLTTSEDITVDTVNGTPTIAVTIGSEVRSADYVPGSGSTELVFTYTIQVGEEDTGGIMIGESLALNGGSLTDAAGNAMTLTLNGLADASSVFVDAISPSISALEVAVPDSYNAGDTLSFTVTASEVITVDTATGEPSIGLDVGGLLHAATYESGSGSSSLVFSYTVVDGDNDSNGIEVQTLSLNDGQLNDAAGNALSLTLPEADTSQILVDTTAPTLVSFTRLSPSTENTAEDSVGWTVTFSEVVNGVSGSSFVLEGTSADIAIASLTSTTYQVMASGGDIASLNGVVGLNLSVSAAISDIADNALVITEPATDQTFTLDNAAPTTVIGVPSATATASTDIAYTVTYTDADNVTLVAADIVLNKTGTADATVSVTGSDAVTRTVTLMDITGDGTLGITVPAETAVDAVGNLAEAGGTSSTVNVDNTLPTVMMTTPTNSPNAFPITVTFSEIVTDFVEAEITATNAIVSEFEGSGTTYTATVTPTTPGIDVTLEVSAGVSVDAVDNPNEASDLNTVTTNTSGAVSINGLAIEGQTLAAIVVDPDNITNAITYKWMSAETLVGGGETYAIQTSDIGNILTVNVSYTDDAGFDETASSLATTTVISIEQNAWRNIGESVDSIGGHPTFDDYRNVGLTSLADADLARIISILNRAVTNQTAVESIDELSELEALVSVILEGQDDDEDGLPNLLEDDGLMDTDTDGTDDRDDVDADNDGIRDNLEIDALVTMEDDDSDGIVNLFDFDVDGDGYGDFMDYTDENLNGVVDELETLATFISHLAPTPVDPEVTDPDAIMAAAVVRIVLDKAAVVDTDGDGIINSLDIDADGDGIFDVIEAGLPDTDENALVDDGTALVEDYAELPDTDANDIADFLAVMSNGTDTDLSLGGVLAALDLDLDGMIDITTDVDQDGLADVVDNAIGAFGSAKDFDGDGIPNHLDPDDDNDNRTDVEENAELAQYFTGTDADGDGIDDGFDALINGVLNGVDENGNGVRDDRELPDLDGDGLVDYLDDDADNDGIRDDIDTDIALPVELAPEATEDDVALDLDGDGVLDSVDPSVNTGTDVKVAGKGSMSLGLLMVLAATLMLMRRRLGLLVALPLAIMAGHSQAAVDNAPSSKLSLVTSVGVSKFDTELTGSSKVTDESGAGFAIGVGYHFTDVLGVELSYSMLGKAGVNTGWVDYNSLAAYLQYRPELVSYGQLRGQLKLGINRLYYGGADGLNLDKDSADVLTFALGADYKVSPVDALEFMFTSYSVDAHFYSVGYRHKF